MAALAGDGPDDLTERVAATYRAEVERTLVAPLRARAARSYDALTRAIGAHAATFFELIHAGLLAHVQAALAVGGPGAVADPAFTGAAELSLKVLRQIDRFAQLERRPAPAADPPSARVRPWREEPGI